MYKLLIQLRLARAHYTYLFPFLAAILHDFKYEALRNLKFQEPKAGSSYLELPLHGYGAIERLLKH